MGILNQSMKRYLEEGVLIDVSGYEQVSPGVYKLPVFLEDHDYADIKKEHWVWSIGRKLDTNEYFASLDDRFYQNPEYECVWLR